MRLSYPLSTHTIDFRLQTPQSLLPALVIRKADKNEVGKTKCENKVKTKWVSF